jgi:hypothetical protein
MCAPPSRSCRCGCAWDRTGDASWQGKPKVPPALPVEGQTGLVPPDALQVAGGAGTRALLGAPKLLQVKLYDIEMSLRGTLRGFGLKVGNTTPKNFEGRVRELVADHPILLAVTMGCCRRYDSLFGAPPPRSRARSPPNPARDTRRRRSW